MSSAITRRRRPRVVSSVHRFRPGNADPDTPDRALDTSVEAGSPADLEPRNGPEAVAFREQQIAEHVRYQRVADAAYRAAARETWANSVPDLRAAWEEHKEKFPEQTHPAPRTQPDGGWVADGDRRLTPEQNAEATKACADLRDEAEQHILPAMLRVEAANPGGRLAGLDHMLKGEDRLKEKIADYVRAPGVTVRELWTKCLMQSDLHASTSRAATLMASWRRRPTQVRGLRAAQAEEPMACRSVQGRQQSMAQARHGRALRDAIPHARKPRSEGTHAPGVRANPKQHGITCRGARD